MERILRIGSVPYLNAKPLVRHVRGNITLLEPAPLAQAFRRGDFDLALIPVVECFLEPDVLILDQVAIGCQGPVYSVILVHEKPLSEIQSIAVDAASLTSVTLLRILLRKHWKLEPTLVQDGLEADAQLLIGDRALHFRQQFPKKQLTDLGAAWRSFTGLPFVFAVWAVQPLSDLSLEELEHFRCLSMKGLNDRKSLAKNAEELVYLEQWIRYDLGGFQKEALRRFAQEVAEAGIFVEHVQTNLDFV
ncbi:MAG: menaquinone biosynthesis protein [Blastochloris sp.]|nr:menaquinone biosynthesis protein [Blastochloris sp.]